MIGDGGVLSNKLLECHNASMDPLWQKEEILAPYTSFKIGGKATRFAEIRSEPDLIEALHEIRKDSDRYFILGGGTNLLVSDYGFEGSVLLIKMQQCEFERDGRVRVDAGFDMAQLVHEASSRGFAGIEWAGGLPGTVGGAVRGNAGCFGGEMKDVIEFVESFTPEGLRMRRRNEECLFGYRDSIFKRNGEIITRVTLKLKPNDDPRRLLSAVENKILWRKARHPLEYPNAGSIFKNIPVEAVPNSVLAEYYASIKQDPFPILPAAKLLDKAGLKGATVGAAQISQKHPNFIINLGGASARDVASLIAEAKKEVMMRFGVALEEEIFYLGTF